MFNRILSKKIFKNTTPYFSIISFYDQSRSIDRRFSHYYALGFDQKIPLTKNNTIHMIFSPEIDLQPKPKPGEFYRYSLFGSMNIGFIFDMYSLFK